MVYYNDEHEKCQSQIIQLLNSMVAGVEFEEDQVDSFSNELCKIYSVKGFRHSYSDISTELEKMCPDQRDALCDRLEQLQQRISSMPKEDADPVSTEVKEKVYKLCDHVDLECLRISRIDKVEYIGKEAKNALNEADGRLNETNKKADELDKRVSDYHSHSISILAIFSGLVITFSGMLQFTSSSLSNLSNTDAYKITYFVCLAFFFLFNTVFMLMYCISKISGKSIAVSCKRTDCKKCRHCSTWIGRLKNKYPYVLGFDVAAVLIIVIVFWISQS